VIFGVGGSNGAISGLVKFIRHRYVGKDNARDWSQSSKVFLIIMQEFQWRRRVGMCGLWTLGTGAGGHNPPSLSHGWSCDLQRFDTNFEFE